MPWQQFVADLKGQQTFTCNDPLPELPGWFDRVQVEQALINMLKNAHEASGAAAEVELHHCLRGRGCNASKCAIAAPE